MSDIRATDPAGSAHHQNAFGFLRLLFASLVIVAHTPELIDGNRSREILTQAFGSISFGDLAVDCFFIISGILIPSSYLASRSVRSYLMKRIARIYPGFIVASLLCLLVVVPAAGGQMTGHWPSAIKAIALLLAPHEYGAFAGTPAPYLNGSLWTIQIEFKCYISVMVLGVARLLDKPCVLAATALALLVLYEALPAGADTYVEHLRHHPEIWGSRFAETCRLVGMFLAGAALRAMKQNLRVKAIYVIPCTAVVLIGLAIPKLAEIGIATAGAYLIYCVAVGCTGTAISKINDPTDISYGVYLYAWPVEKLLIGSGYIASLWLLGMATWAVAVVLGTLSWFIVERPCKELLRWRPSRRARTATA